MKRILLFCLMFICSVSSAGASVMVCQKGVCDHTTGKTDMNSWLQKLRTLFETSNVRIDFCEADFGTHLCLHPNLDWTAQSANIDVSFRIPVARTLPHKNTLLIDYMVSANEALPACSPSNSIFEVAGNNTFRLASQSFDCKILGLSPTKLQNTFFIDYIDFDNAVAGAQYTIQTHGEINGTSTGYTLMKFRDGDSLLPIVVQPYRGKMPEAPNIYAAPKIEPKPAPQPPESFLNKFATGVKTWWDKLKESFVSSDEETERLFFEENDDKMGAMKGMRSQNKITPKKERSTPDCAQETWWDRFTDTFMKVIYLEPLD